MKKKEVKSVDLDKAVEGRKRITIEILRIHFNHDKFYGYFRDLKIFLLSS